MADFDAARFAAIMSDLIRPLLGRPTELLAFDEVRERLQLASFVDRGVREVELARIVGTLDRGGEFSRVFLPRDPALRERWERMRRLAEGPQGFAPVELYQVGDLYFVVDGHHRVSVARALGAKTIEAQVREFPTPLEIPPNASLEDIERAVMARARADFLATAGIAPESAGDFLASEVGAYERLLDHIRVHRYFRGLEPGESPSWEEGVASWLRNVYRPMVDIVRQSGILAAFPGRTETDLYLFTMDHLHELRERFGPDVPMERGVEAAEALAPRRRKARRAVGEDGK
jgi:hypothetical protein